MIKIINTHIVFFGNHFTSSFDKNIGKTNIKYNDNLDIRFDFTNTSNKNIKKNDNITICNKVEKIFDIYTHIPIKDIFKNNHEEIIDYLRNKRPFMNIDNNLEEEITSKIKDFLNNKDLKDIKKYIQKQTISKNGNIINPKKSLIFQCLCGSSQSNSLQ
jgi:hypothetical protein